MSYESSPSKSRIDRLRDSLAKFGEDYTFCSGNKILLIKDVETLLRKHEELLDGKKAENIEKSPPDENQTGKDLFKQLAKANRILKDADDNVSKYSKGKSLSDLQEDKTYKLLIDIRDRAQSSSNAHHYIVEEVEDKILPKLLGRN